jgi:aspartate-semialdehyde dehydrogenase
LLLLRAQKAGAIVRAMTTVFEPASERGQKGMDELHQQAVNLLSFQPLPKDVYDAQVAFNMIARYGQKAPMPLDSVEAHVLRHYQKIAGASAPNPSLMLVQAPIFHGYALALFLEFAEQVSAEKELVSALAGDHLVIPGVDDDPASNVSVAGQADILLSVKSDPSQSNGLWLWAAADNVRISALTAVECAESMIATRPVGKIQ